MQCTGVCAVQCDALKFTAMQCSSVQCNVMQCNAMQFNAMHQANLPKQCNSAAQCDGVRCNEGVGAVSVFKRFNWSWPYFPFGFLGAGGRLPKARRGLQAWAGFCCVILTTLPKDSRSPCVGAAPDSGAAVVVHWWGSDFFQMEEDGQCETIYLLLRCECVVVEKQGQGAVVGRASSSGRSAEEVRKK